MMIYIYDGSFEGLLSAVFTSFADKIFPRDIVEENRYQLGLLDDARSIGTNEDQAERVLRALDHKSKGRGALLVYKMFLSGLPEIEMTIFHLIKTLMDRRENRLNHHLKVLDNPLSVLDNYANPHVAQALRIEKMIGREVHRMHAFVRFQKSADGIFRALINPDFNVLPLIATHFERRYADQPWVILDTLRHYALYYNLSTTRIIGPDDALLAPTVNEQREKGHDQKEDLYQQLWVDYFNSVNIQERKNTKLHLRHMPRRYWRHLVEKTHPGYIR